MTLQEIRYIKDAISKLDKLAIEHKDYGTDEYHLCHNSLLSLDALEKMTSSQPIISESGANGVCQHLHDDIKYYPDNVGICKCGLRKGFDFGR